MIVLIIKGEAKAQNLMFDFQFGLGTYSMSGLKKINNNALAKIPFDTKLVSDFPAYWYYRPLVLMKFEDKNLGLIYTYQSTGSRISGKDYSGEYRFDMVVNSHCPGLYGNANVYLIGNFIFSVDASAGLNFSNLKINEYLNVFDSVITNKTTTFKALNYYFEPGLDIKYSFKHFYFGFNTGYFVTIGKEAFYTENDKQNKLYDGSNGSPIKPEWNGFRFGLSVSYYIYHKTLIKPSFK